MQDKITINSFNKITWNSIIAGVIASIFCYIFLCNLGVAIGFTVLDPNKDINIPILTNALLFWSLITSLVAIMIGSYIASEYSNAIKNKYKYINGLITYAVIMVLASAAAFPFVAQEVSNTNYFYQSKDKIEHALAISMQNKDLDKKDLLKIKKIKKELQIKLNEKYNTLHKMSWWCFIVKLLSLFAAILGCWLGTNKELNNK